jgi:hypothetical protein
MLDQEAYVTQAGPALLEQRLDALKAQPAPTDPQDLAAYNRQIAALEFVSSRRRQ